jgi:hypothetical protein
MVTRLVAFLLRKKLVRLKDFEGDFYLTWTNRKASFTGDSIAYVYPFSRIGRVILHSDGTCNAESYIKQWEWY